MKIITAHEPKRRGRGRPAKDPSEIKRAWIGIAVTQDQHGDVVRAAARARPPLSVSDYLRAALGIPTTDGR